MTTPNERLRIARERHFKTAADAAEALGVPYGTYAGHENGYRGFPAKRAPAYARKFKVSEEWLLYGKGEGEPEAEISEAELRRMIENALRELPIGVTIGDLPQYVAPSLREQLEQYRANAASPRTPAGATSPDKASRSPGATKPTGPA